MKDAGASGLTRSLVRDAHRASTKSVYASHWKAWVDWCRSVGINPSSPTHVQLANHLSHAAVNLSMSASALRVRRSAILTTCRQINPSLTLPLSLTSDVIKAIALRRARQRTRIPAWDLRLVLQFLTSERFEPLENASFKELTRKAVFLIMLASGRRASEVHALSGLPPDVRLERDGSYTLNFLPEFLAKNQSPEEPSPSIHIRPLSHIADEEDSDFRLCPVRALKSYIKRTKSRRQGSLRRLFLPCSDTRHKDVIKSCISRWVSSLIKDAYASLAPQNVAREPFTSSERRGGGATLIPLSQARTHEVRAWGTTLAATQSTHLDQVLQAAYWRSSDVFTNFYLRDISCLRLDGLHAISSVVAAGQRVSV